MLINPAIYGIINELTVSFLFSIFSFLKTRLTSPTQKQKKPAITTKCLRVLYIIDPSPEGVAVVVAVVAGGV